MSVRQTIKRHYKIISLLQKKPLTYKELQDEISLDPDSVEEKLMTSQRTFQRDIQDIASIYGIEIGMLRSDNRYYIKDDVELQNSQRLRENFEILNAIRLSRSMGSNLICEERKPLGTEHMSGLLYAIQNNFQVEFNYKKYIDDTQSHRQVKPIALKEARNRWYLIGADIHDNNRVKNFSLDRILNLKITNKNFKPIRYNVYQKFKDSFGIINGTDEPPVKVILSFTSREGKYIESLPIHHSQELILKTEEEYRFSYFIRPTYDFRMEILSYGDQVKVLKPESLRNNITDNLKNTLKLYKV